MRLRRRIVALVALTVAGVSLAVAAPSPVSSARQHAAILPAIADTPAVVADAGSRATRVVGVVPFVCALLAGAAIALAFAGRALAPASLQLLVGEFGFGRRRRAPPALRS
jgi:hypothetical protein